MSEKINFVIVGTGNISNTYIKAIENVDDAEISGFVSRTLKKPKNFEKHKSVKLAKNIEGIRNECDAVILCTPNGLHHVGAIEAASLGKHVLTEKPLDISISSMDKMINRCREAKVKLGVVYQKRMCPDNILLKKLINEGKLGKIFGVNLSVKYYRHPKYYSRDKYRGAFSIDGGGPFMQQASHYIDLYSWFFGRPKKVVSLLDTFIHQIDGEDFGAALLHHENRMIGTIVASTAVKPGFNASFEIHSDKGTVVVENDIITKWFIDDLENPSKQHNQTNKKSAVSPSVTYTDAHEIIIKDFIDSIKTNRDPAITGESAKSATEIILEIYKKNLLKQQS